MIGLLPKVYSVIGGVSKALCKSSLPVLVNRLHSYLFVMFYRDVDLTEILKIILTINMHIIQINGKIMNMVFILLRMLNP